MMSIKLTSTNIRCRRPCLSCSRHSGNDAVVGEVFDNGESTGRVVCARCLSDPDAVMADLRQRVDGYRAKAAQRGELFGTTVPTLDEWKQVMEEAHEVYCQSSTAGPIH
jgi:hypothetical protein